MMRDGRMVIDSIQAKLVFRIDNHSATAQRVASGGR
jgi:type IV secretion system protein VirB9